jgi:hypothetical protein
MRAIGYYIYLSFLLLCGGNHLYADTHQAATHFSFSQNKEVKQQVKHKNSRHHGSLKESADIEVDEEFHTSDEHNDTGVNKILAEKHSLYLTFSRQIIFKDYSNNFTIYAPFSVHSNPIYLRIGVFRI